MPSSKSEIQDIPSSDAFKQLFISIEKKKRNLEKKKNKLEEYKKKQDQGETLNADQLKAVEKFDGVLQSIELIKEIVETTQQINAENERTNKKAAKKEKQERERLISEEKERYCRESVLNILHVQSILNDLGNSEVRNWFENGLHGAEPLASNELECLDAIYTMLNPSHEAFPESDNFDTAVLKATEFALNLVEGINKPILDTTYVELHKLFERIRNCQLYKLNMRPVAEVKREAPHQNGVSVETKLDNEDESFIKNNAEFAQNDTPFETVEERIAEGNEASLDSRPEMSHSFVTEASCPPVKESIDEVLLPLRSNFNFLQLSEVAGDSTSVLNNNSNDFSRKGFVPTGVSDQGDSSEISHGIDKKQSFDKDSWANPSWSSRAKQDDSYFSSTGIVNDQKVDSADENQNSGDVFSSASQSAFLQPEDDPGSLRGYGGRGRAPRGGGFRGGRDPGNRDGRGNYRGARGGVTSTNRITSSARGGVDYRGGGGMDFRGGSRSGFRSDRGSGRGGQRGSGSVNKEYQDVDQRKGDGKPRESRKEFYRGGSTNGEYGSRNGGSNSRGVYFNSREKQEL